MHAAGTLFFFLKDGIGISAILPFYILMVELLPTFCLLVIASCIIIWAQKFLFTKHRRLPFILSVIFLCLLAFLKFDYAMYDHYPAPTWERGTRSIIWERILGEKTFL